MQALNELLAVQAKDGSEDALLMLWDHVRRLAWKFMPRWRAAAEAGGLTAEDLTQTAFLALLRAVDAYDPGRGLKFSTLFTIALRTEVFTAAGIRTEKQSKDPLRYAASLDVPAADDDPEGETLGDLIEDPAAAEAVDYADLRLDIAAVLEELPEEQRAAVVQRYWFGVKVDEKTHNAALRALRHPSRSKGLQAFRWG